MNMIVAFYVLDLFRFHGFDRSYVSTLTVCCEAFLLMFLFLNLMKWGLYMNRVYVICFMSIYFLSAALKIPKLLETSDAQTKELFAFGFMMAVALFFLDVLIRLEKRRKGGLTSSVTETDLLDS